MQWSIHVERELACSIQTSYVRPEEEKSRKAFCGVLGAFIFLGSTDLKEWAPKLYTTMHYFIKFTFYRAVIGIVRIP